MISLLTAALRFDGALTVDVNAFQTSLVPYPRIHFMLSLYTAIISAEKAHNEQLSISVITTCAFEPSSMVAKDAAKALPLVITRVSLAVDVYCNYFFVCLGGYMWLMSC